MLQPKPRPATYADIEALPPNVVGEILFDVLHVQARPAPQHGHAAGELYQELNGRFGQRGSREWVFLPEPELHLGPHTVVPDIAGWRRSRMPKLPDTPYIEIVPDWIAEVLSPSTEKIDRTDKLAIYATHAVPYCWYVSPMRRTLEVLALTDGKWLITHTVKDADAVTAPPFELLTFQLDILWWE
jgi:Uma2 family endonuclease